MDFASRLVTELLHKDKAVDKIGTEREKWASDPVHTQKLYAHMQRMWVPDDKAKKLGVGAPLEKIEALLHDEDPRKTLGTEAHEEFMKVLPYAPKDMHPRQVAATVYNKMLADRAPDLFNYARKQDTSMFGTGLLGNKYKLGPLQEYYDKWREEENKAAPGIVASAFGHEGLGRYFDKDEAPTAYGFAAGTGAVAMGAREIAARRIASGSAGAIAKMIGKGAVASPHPLLKVAGAALLAIPEFMAWDTAMGAAKGTEWYRARDVKVGDVGIAQALSSSDWWKTTGIDAALGIAGLKLGTTAVKKGGLALAKQQGIVEGGGLDILTDITRAEKMSQVGLSDMERSLQQSVAKGLAFPDPENLLRAMENKNAVDLGMRDFHALRRTGDDARVQVLADYAHTLSGEAGAGLGMTAEDKTAESLLDVLATGKATGMNVNQSVAVMAEKLRRGIIEEGGTGLSAATEKKMFKNKTIKSMSEQLREVKDLDSLNEKINKGMKLEDAVRDQKLAETTLGEYFPDSGFGGPEIAKSNKIKAFEREQNKVARGRTMMELQERVNAPAVEEVAPKIEDVIEKSLAEEIKPIVPAPKDGELLKKPASQVYPPAVVSKQHVEDKSEQLFQAAIKNPENEAKAARIVSDVMSKPEHPDRAIAESYISKMKEHNKKLQGDTPAAKAETEKIAAVEKDAEEMSRLINEQYSEAAEAGISITAPSEVTAKMTRDQHWDLKYQQVRRILGKTTTVGAAAGAALMVPGLSFDKMGELIKGGLTMQNLSDIDPGAAEAAGVSDRVVGALVTDAFKGVYKNTTEMYQAFKDMRLMAPKVDPANKYAIQDLQKGVTITPDPNPANMIARRKKLPMFFDMLMTPFAKAQVYYGKTDGGREMLTNPMVSAASHYTASINNTEHMFEVLKNITDDIPGFVNESKMISKEMAGLNQEYALRHTFEGYSRGTIADQSKIVAAAEKTLKKKSATPEDIQLASEALREAQIKVKIHSDMLKENEGFWGEFNKRWEVKMQELTDRSSSARISLAVEDTSDFTRYPWLRDKLTRDELIATGRLKKFNEQAALNMKEQGMPVIENVPYIHHASHPDTDFMAIKKELDKMAWEGGDEAFRLAKFHSRSSNSLQMMPDVTYIYSKYIPDYNRRLQWNDFWKPGKKDGWAAHANNPYVQNSEGLKKFWDGFKRGFDPVDISGTDKLARRMYDFEIARLLALSPSVAFKHAMKLEANWSNFGIGESAKVLPKSIDLLRRMRFTKDVPQDLETTAARSFTNQGRIYQTALEYDTFEVPQKTWDNMIQKFNDKGSILIDTTERFDRGHSFLAASEMALKQGMTPAQAAYGIYDTILKTNFLSGPMNPAWLRDPKIRMMMMFQGTPYKILEQRAIQAYRAGQGVKGTWETLQALKSDIKEGESLFKMNLIMDGLKRERDIFGTPVTMQMMRKMLIIGSVVMGGKMAFDADLWSHFSHPPFLKFQQSEFGLAAMPVAQAAHQAYGKERGEDEYFLSDFFNSWLKDGLLQAQFIKANRLSKNDIPERYKDSALKYVFGIPAVAEKNK